MRSIVDSVLAPSGLVAALLIAAVIFAFALRRRQVAGYFILAAGSLYLVFGSGLAAVLLMGSLESGFAPGQDVESDRSVEVVVVLAGYAFSDSRRPISGQVNSASSSRVLEAARLTERSPHARVVISGRGEVPVIMRELLIELGVPRSKVAIEQNSEDTYESAVHLREQLTGRTFYLVTSAGHMPRAMGVFGKQGLTAIAAPTDYLSPTTLTDSSMFPSARNLAISDLAVHEYLGMLWYRLLDRI